MIREPRGFYRIFYRTGRNSPVVHSTVQHGSSNNPRSDGTGRTQQHPSTPRKSEFKLERVRPSVITEGLAEAQVRFPTVPIVFCETRPLAQEWAYRFLGAAVEHHGEHAAAGRLEKSLPVAGPLAPAEPTPAHVRAWAISRGLSIATKGRIRPEIVSAYRNALADG